jgi:exodeoxyribonuclease V beta subunit
MAESMVNNQYFLQYHIYAVAMHKYLSTRLPGYDYERDFGGVYYLFLRGIESEMDDENGIYFDKPEPTLINELTALLIP